MRATVACAVLIASCSHGGAHGQADASLRISVVMNKPDAGGTLRLALCPDQRAYDSEQGCTLRNVAVKQGMAEVTITGLVLGNWAIKVFHDENDNGVLDTNWLGLPQEPYGFGNDAPVNMGPPGFKAAAVELKVGANQARVRLRGG